MFAKCLKHELKATSRVLVPLFICMIIVSIAATVCFGALMALEGVTVDNMTENGEIIIGEAQEQSLLYNVLDIVTMLLFIAFFVVMIMSVVSVFVLMIRRFYTSFFTDEGYLTFTLPVTVDCHILTKSVSMMIWNVISYVAMVISVAIFIFGLYLSIPEAFEIDEYVKVALEQVFDEFGRIYGSTIAFAVVQSVVSSIASFLLMYFSISVGCMLTKKHRFIVCAACVLVISGVVSEIMAIATEIIAVPFRNMEYSDESMGLLMMTALLISTVLYIAQGVGCYLGTRWILRNKINLD